MFLFSSAKSCTCSALRLAAISGSASTAAAAGGSDDEDAASIVATPPALCASTLLFRSISRRIRTSINPLCTRPAVSTPRFKNHTTLSRTALSPAMRPSSSSSSGDAVAAAPPAAQLASAPNPLRRRRCCTTAFSDARRTFSACASLFTLAEMSRHTDLDSASMASRSALLRYIVSGPDPRRRLCVVPVPVKRPARGGGAVER